MSADPTLTERANDPSSGPAHAEPIAVEANVVGARGEKTQSRDDEIDEWFAQAATTYVSDNGDTPEHERLGTATLPVHDVLVRPPRPKPGLMCSSTAARRRRALTLATFALVIVVIIDMRLVSSQTTTVTEPVNTTDASASIDKLGAAVDRRLKRTIARQQHADTQRRAQARRRHASGRREHARATAAGDTPPRRGPHSRHHASSRQARCGISGCTPRPVPTRLREAAPRRSICGPFDLC